MDAAHPGDSYPLTPFAGERPPAPAWFAEAVAQRPQVHRLTVQGAGIEILSWGQPGNPGIALVHGHSAHAGWWRHIAPSFATSHHVVALSWAGMGGSDWRRQYGTTQIADEIEAVMRAMGFLSSTHKPLLVGHSMGSAPCVILASRIGRALRGVIMIDGPMREQARPRMTALDREHFGYPSLEAALVRFRYTPPQRCDTPFIADLFAREGLIDSIDTGSCG